MFNKKKLMMKKSLFLLLFFFFSVISCNKEENSADYCGKQESTKNNFSANAASKVSSYGIYGEVLWPVSGTPYNAVESPTVYIYKYINGYWVYQGSTTASICGYYTYNTGGTGTFRAIISNYYYLRSYPGCTTRVDYGMHAGSGDGAVTIYSPWTTVNIRCS